MCSVCMLTHKFTRLKPNSGALQSLCSTKAEITRVYLIVFGHVTVIYCWFFGWWVRKRSGVPVRRPKPAGGADTLITTHPPSQSGLKNVLKLVCVRKYSETAKCVCLFKTNRAVWLKYFQGFSFLCVSTHNPIIPGSDEQTCNIYWFQRPNLLIL